jgi:hypothetical protein
MIAGSVKASTAITTVPCDVDTKGSAEIVDEG